MQKYNLTSQINEILPYNISLLIGLEKKWQKQKHKNSFKQIDTDKMNLYI